MIKKFIFSAMDYYVHKILYKDMTNFGIISLFAKKFHLFYKKRDSAPEKQCRITLYYI